MVPGTSTGPGENKENPDRRDGETSDHGEQVRSTRNFCNDILVNDQSFKTLSEEFHQGTKTKDQLREEFKKRLKGISREKREKMGITSASNDITDTEIETFLSQTKCFDNQLLSRIQNDIRGKEKAKENIVDSCLDVAHDEYGDFDENELRKTLKKEDFSRLRTFLEVPKYRKTYIKKLSSGHSLTEKNFSDVDFGAITKSIAELDPTNPKRREIQEAWLKIAQVAHPDNDLASAFHEIAHEGKKTEGIAGAYEAFFSDKNSLVSRENREKILNFLTQQYTPLVPLGVLEVLDKQTYKSFLTSAPDAAELEKDLPSDPELAEALKKDRQEQWEKIYKNHIGGGKTMIGARSLPFETKIRLLSELGSVGKAEKMLEYYRGKPNSLRKSTDTGEDFRTRFKNTYDNLDPEKLDTRAGLTEELIARLDHRVGGIENFDAGCAMEWKTKNAKGEEIIGYSIIDTVPGDSIDEENIITVRFLGDNKDPLSPGGLTRHYTGADFYNYLDGCPEDGKITFRKRSEFDTEINQNTTDKKYPRYFTEEETKKELREQFPDSIEVRDINALNADIDALLNPKSDHKKEAKTRGERELHEGMVFCKVSEKGTETFQIKSIDDAAGTITLWDGWGTGEKSVTEMSFHEFLLTLKGLKKSSSDIYRLPTDKKSMGISQFNQLCLTEGQYEDGMVKKMAKLNIREENGKNIFGEMNPKTGIYTATPVIKIGDKKDLYIESIEGSTVTYRCGTFTQGIFDKEKDKYTTDTSFSGSPELTMSLEMLWAYLQNNQNFELDKPIEKAQRKEKKEKNSSMSWWNVLMHSHSLGVILNGDLWSAPFKAWEEQHNKDHAFAGKMTAALAMEKLQSGNYGPISTIMNWAEWPSLMVADGNGSFQSYLNELVEKIDGMGSYHRARLIKKWSRKEHFPSPKFMAAIMASMKIFGQLYPYDGGENDYQNADGTHEWFWYNSICHSLDPGHNKYPHMPPKKGDKWPEKWTKEGFKMNEIDVLYELFNDFQHPMLKNLGRRFQKYMNEGQKGLADGGEGNLNQRTTMTEKLDWMMSAAVSGKLPELFGGSTELWLTEGYSTEISTMPYAAVLFGCREEQMLSPTREHIKSQFQSGYHMPPFVFMQNKDFGDIFRETGVAFAYTISPECGIELEKITKDAEGGRLSGNRAKKWKDKFQKFWKKHGKELMNKMSGMRDPMLNLMISDPILFDELLQNQPEEKKKQYKVLREKKGTIGAYYQRLRDTYGDATSHATMERGKGFYAGDHFRFRDGFDSGVPIAWINWDNYIDANVTDEFASGGGNTAGDGVFNEMRGFLYKIPKMAEKMAEQMGFKGSKMYIEKITKSLFEKNRDPMKRLLEEKIKAENPKAEYCSMTGMMLEIIPPQLFVVGGSSTEENVRYKKYFEQIKASLRKAKEIEDAGDYAKALTYRCEMAERWSRVIKSQIPTDKLTIEQIHKGNFEGDELEKVKKYTQARSGTVLAEKLDAFDTHARQGKDGETNTPRNGNSDERNQAESEEN